MVIVPYFFFEEFRFGLHADFIVLVDFLHVLGSIEGRFVSAPNTFKQTLGLLCRNYCFGEGLRQSISLIVVYKETGAEIISNFPD